MVTSSLVITTHNRVEMLKKAIQSAITAGSEVEVIVVDDASIDDTEKYCRSLDGIRYVRLDKNVRTAGARNAGIAASSGEFIAFLDDDDLRLPWSVDAQASILGNDLRCGLVYGKFFVATPDGRYDEGTPLPSECFEGDLLERLIRLNFLCLSTCMVRRSVLEDVGPFDTSPDMYGIEDWDLWLRIAGRYSIRALPEPVAIYRQPLAKSGQWSSDIPRQFGRVGNAYRKKWLKLPRVRALLEMGKISRSELLDSVVDRILYDISANSTGRREKLTKTIRLLRFRPTSLRRLTFYKTLIRALIIAR